jgi:hypothetical protein
MRSPVTKPTCNVEHALARVRCYLTHPRRRLQRWCLRGSNWNLTKGAFSPLVLQTFFFSYSFIFALLPFLSVGVNCESKGQYRFNLALLANALVPLGAKHLASWPIRRRCSCVKGKEEQERVRKTE